MLVFRCEFVNYIPNAIFHLIYLIYNIRTITFLYRQKYPNDIVGKAVRNAGIIPILELRKGSRKKTGRQQFNRDCVCCDPQP